MREIFYSSPPVAYKPVPFSVGETFVNYHNVAYVEVKRVTDSRVHLEWHVFHGGEGSNGSSSCSLQEFQEAIRNGWLKPYEPEFL